MNKFDFSLKEVFEIIKDQTPRLLNQLLSFHPILDLENYYYQRYTPLMEAVYLSRLDMVQFICENLKKKYSKGGTVMPQYKSYINQVSIDGKTALLIATLSNVTPEIIKYLLMEGADINIRDKEDHDVFYYAKYSTTEDIENFGNTFKKS